MTDQIQFTVKTGTSDDTGEDFWPDTRPGFPIQVR